MPQTIGLCMIVRDEAAVIERCLASVRPLIDTWTICDTGSKDGTPELIEQALADLPGTLHRRPWRDFGANRSELAELAHGSADYLLLLDADHTVEQRGPLPPLSADAYLLRHTGSLAYAVPRLLRGDRRWWFEGATHEYLATEGEHAQEVLEALAVHHHGDGSSRAEKFERDRRLLEATLERDPTDARATFYLAQTLRDLGEPEPASELYGRRIELGGWDEEVFYAAYQHGALVGQRDPDAAMPLLLDAFERRPQRAEPLHELARLCRLRRGYRSAYLFAGRAAAVPYPGDVLFVHSDVYEWGALFELAVAAYWVGEYSEALELNERLLAAGTLPPDYATAAWANRRYCLEALGRDPDEGPQAPFLANLVGGAPATAQISLQVEPEWNQFNPSIARDGEAFRAIVRTANYRLIDGRYEMDPVDEGVIRTLNYLVHLDESLALQSVAPLADSSDGPPTHPARVVGYEDCRLVQVGGRWYATATVRDRHPDELCQIALLELDGAEITRVRLLEGPDPERHEKNWMPFERDGRLHLVYTCGPTIVYACDPASGELEPVAEHEAPPQAAELRGGSQGVPVEDGWLFAVHEAFDNGPRGRSYLHRLVRLGEDLRLAAISPRFTFAGEPIEICLGLARWEDRLVFSYGLGDSTAHLAVCPLEAALELLEPVREHVAPVA